MKNQLEGKKFERLTVIKDSGERDNGKGVVWLCKCDCGELTYVMGYNLLRGNTKSCGCLRRELSSKRRRMAKK